MKNQLILSLPKLSKKLNLTVIQNPVDFGDIKSKSKENIGRLKDKRYLVAAGRLVPAKGFDILIDAFHNISGQFHDLELIILGAGKDKENLEQKRNLLGMENIITFPGYVTNVYPYFKEADACVLSSRIEGFPNVLLQMMSQNTKAVATLSAGDIENIPGIFTCKPGNPEELSAAIKNCLLSNTDVNRSVFDDYLKGRTQEMFYSKIMEQIKS
ncbi:glycosyltransferase [Flavobacteriaceae bacterium F89]|uniref:Glycosyltransferase n=1 Tax=Cerina litoralis TaxID=2874477 RepID=A0AAE3EU58_9FLAO|nr:glycosyltransferase [Cerina litoralis]MCG2461180.1 glycosyltransferase [Cerina litoralis]